MSDLLGLNLRLISPIGIGSERKPTSSRSLVGEVFERVVSEVDDLTFTRLSLGMTEEVRVEFVLLAVQVLSS